MGYETLEHSAHVVLCNSEWVLGCNVKILLPVGIHQESVTAFDLATRGQFNRRLQAQRGGGFHQFLGEERMKARLELISPALTLSPRVFPRPQQLLTHSALLGLLYAGLRNFYASHSCFHRHFLPYSSSCFLVWPMQEADGNRPQGKTLSQRPQRHRIPAPWASVTGAASSGPIWHLKMAAVLWGGSHGGLLGFIIRLAVRRCWKRHNPTGQCTGQCTLDSEASPSLWVSLAGS